MRRQKSNNALRRLRRRDISNFRVIVLRSQLLPVGNQFCRLAASSSETQLSSPGSVLSVKGCLCCGGFFDGCKVDKEVVVVTRLEAFGGMRSDELGDCLALIRQS